MFYTNVTKIGNTIYHRFVDNGIKRIEKIKYNPIIYTSTNEETNFKSLEGKFVKEKIVGNFSDTRDFYERNKDVSGFDIYGTKSPVFNFINNTYKNNIHFNIEEIKIAYIDIECHTDGSFPDPTVSEFPINAICFRINKTKTYLFALQKDYQDDYIPENTETYLFDNEDDLLKKFISVWTFEAIDILVSWNGEGFDIPYIYNRLKQKFSDKIVNSLSPYNKIIEKKVHTKFGEEIHYDILGIAHLDYIDVYKNFTFVNRESYKLDYIAEIELGEKKVEYSEYDNLFDLYEKDFQLFLDYNVQDTMLLEKLENKLKLIEVAVNIAYTAKINYNDVFSPVKTWENIIENFLYERGIIADYDRTTFQKKEKFEGAYVKEPKIGEHRWIVSFDFTSLYPNLIRTLNISPETIKTEHPKIPIEKFLEKDVEYFDDLKKNNTILTANCIEFDRSKEGFFPAVVSFILDSREKHKAIYKKSNKLKDVVEEPTEKRKQERIAVANYNYQMTYKILANSLFGAAGNPYFKYYDLRLAEAITISGQFSIRWVEKKVNEYFNEIFKFEKFEHLIVFGDTDSVYITLSPIVDKLLKDATEEKQFEFVKEIAYGKLSEVIDNAVNEMCEMLNVKNNTLTMKVEAIAKNGISLAKKKYALNLYHMEGKDYKEPEIKMIGVEAKKSSTPSSCRERLEQAIKIILQGNQEELIEFVSKFQEEWKTLDPKEIAFNRSINGLRKYSDGDNYIKGTPIHVRASILYNRNLKLKKLNNHYEIIKEGSKIKFLYLTTPNPTHENVIAFPNRLPKELNLHDYIDRTLQFDKSFLEPLRMFLQINGWEYEEKHSLDSFFS